MKDNNKAEFIQGCGRLANRIMELGKELKALDTARRDYYAAGKEHEIVESDFTSGALGDENTHVTWEKYQEFLPVLSEFIIEWYAAGSGEPKVNVFRAMKAGGGGY